MITPSDPKHPLGTVVAALAIVVTLLCCVALAVAVAVAG